MSDLGVLLPLGALGLRGLDTLALRFKVALDSFSCFVQALVPEMSVVLERGRVGGVATHALDDVDVGAGCDGHRYSGATELVGLEGGVNAGIDEEVLPDNSPSSGVARKSWARSGVT